MIHMYSSDNYSKIFRFRSGNSTPNLSHDPFFCSRDPIFLPHSDLGSRPEIVRYMVWNSILADVKILKVHTCKRVSSYLKTLKIYLWTWKFIPENMKVHTYKHQVHTLKPGVHIKIINFCIGSNKIQKILALRRAVVQEVSSLWQSADWEVKCVICGSFLTCWLDSVTIT